MNLLENMELERDLERGVNDWEGLRMIGAWGGQGQGEVCRSS